MKISNKMWPISKFVGLRTRIQHQPDYQRGPAWPPPKQQLLVDSLLRQLDVPKLYLAKSQVTDLVQYRVIDGQQRLTSIWAFADDELLLDKLPHDIASVSWDNKSYTSLRKIDRKQFDEFVLVVALVENATDEEERELFARLQQEI